MRLSRQFLRLGGPADKLSKRVQVSAFVEVGFI
jgi:hypothetical protein